MKTIRIGTAEVIYTPEGCFTRYEDGTTYGAHPHDTPDYREVTQRCGYGEDRLRFCREHDVVHLLCAEWFGFGSDNVIWKLAHNIEPDKSEAAREEMMVQTIQRWIRMGERPIIGDVSWYALRDHFIGVLDG